MQPEHTQYCTVQTTQTSTKSASYLESKEASSGKQYDWHSLKKHLPSNYSEILYDTPCYQCI